MEQAHRIKRLKLAASAVGLCGFALVAGATLIPLGEFQFPGTSVEAEREGQLPTTVFRAASPVAGPALSASDEQCAKACEKFLNMGPAPDALISYLACLDLCPKPPPKPPP